MFTKRFFHLLFLTVSLLVGDNAFAHTTEASGFISGFLHPVLGVDHLVAMVAVGILGAILGGSAIWLLPVYFPLVMAVGGVLGIKGIPLPYAEQLIALSGIVLGALILIYRKFNIVAAGALVAFFALFHGHAHGVELPDSTSPVEYCVGFVMGTGSLHMTGILLSLVEKINHGKAILRGCGAAISLVGCYFLLS